MKLLRALADFAYGIHAGNAIRHGLPAPNRRSHRAPRRESGRRLVLVRPDSDGLQHL